MPLIIHADDFGISESVSRCIAECFDRGWVSETSLMVNMPYADEAIGLARRQGFVNSVGLHLNLSEGKPLTRAIQRFPRLCTSDGVFNKAFHMRQLTRFILSKSERNAIRDEIRAQLEKFMSYDGLLRRLDSHHHVHTDWVIYKELFPIARELGFTGMRLSATLHKVGKMAALYKKLFNGQLRRYFDTRDDFDGFCERCIREAMVGKSVEVMVHPMYSKEGSIMDTSMPYSQMIDAIKSAGADIQFVGNV